MVHCCKYVEKRKRRWFCVEIEPTSLQALKSEPSNKIGSRNRHQWFRCELKLQLQLQYASDKNINVSISFFCDILQHNNDYIYQFTALNSYFEHMIH